MDRGRSFNGVWNGLLERGEDGVHVKKVDTYDREDNSVVAAVGRAQGMDGIATTRKRNGSWSKPAQGLGVSVAGWRWNMAQRQLAAQSGSTTIESGGIRHGGGIITGLCAGRADRDGARAGLVRPERDVSQRHQTGAACIGSDGLPPLVELSGRAAAMFRFEPGLKVYLHREPVDGRKAIKWLALLVEQSRDSILRAGGLCVQ